MKFYRKIKGKKIPFTATIIIHIVLLLVIKTRYWIYFYFKFLKLIKSFRFYESAWRDLIEIGILIKLKNVQEHPASNNFIFAPSYWNLFIPQIE